MAMVRAMIHGGNSTMQVDCPSGEMTNPAVQTPEGGLPSESLTDSLDEVWRRAEEEYGLVRSEPGETIIAVHRQTSQRLAVAHETWDEILYILNCRLRRYSLILLLGIMTFVTSGRSLRCVTGKESTCHTRGPNAYKGYWTVIT